MTYWIAKLLVDLLDDGQHVLQFGGECVRIEVGHAKQRADLRQNGRHLQLEMQQLAQTLLDDLRKGQQTQCVTRGRCVEDDRGKVHGFDQSASGKVAIISIMCRRVVFEMRKTYFMTSA